MKSALFRIGIFCIGVSLTAMMFSCQGGIKPGEQPQIDQQALQALVDEARMPETGEPIEGMVVEDASATPRDAVNLKPRSLEPGSAEFIVSYGFPNDIKPNLIISANRNTKFFEEAVSVKALEKLMMAAEVKLAVSLAGVSNVMFACKVKEGECAEWFVIANGVDSDKLVANLEPLKIDQNSIQDISVYKHKEYFIVTHQDVFIAGTKNMVFYVIDPNGYTIVNTFRVANQIYPLVVAADFPHKFMIEKVMPKLEFIKFDQFEDASNYILTAVMKYLVGQDASKAKVELALRSFVDEAALSSAIFEVDSNMIDWNFFAEKIAKVLASDVDKVDYDQIDQNQPANAKPMESDADKIDQNLPDSPKVDENNVIIDN